MDQTFNLSRSLTIPRQSNDAPSEAISRLSKLIESSGYNFVMSFTGQGSLVHQNIRTACQRFEINREFLKSMCECVSTTLDDLMNENQNLREYYEAHPLVTIDGTNIDAATFWSTTNESSTSLYHWATSSEDEPFPFNSYTIQRCEWSFVCIAIASVLNVLYFCEHLDTHPYEVFELARRSHITMIGHSQGVLSSVIAHGLSLSPNRLLSNWKKTPENLEFLMKAIKVHVVIGAIVAEQSYRIEKAMQYILPDLPKGALSMDSPERSSCLLSVEGLEEDQLVKVIDEVNQQCTFLIESAIAEYPDLESQLEYARIDKSTKLLSLALVNASKNFVIAGPNKALQYIANKLKLSYPITDANIARIPFSQRRPQASADFLPISAPFHSGLLKSIEGLIIDECTKRNLETCCTPNTSEIRIISPIDGSDFMKMDNGMSVLTHLVSSVCSESMNFTRIHASLLNDSIILCLGPGSDGHSTALNAMNCSYKGSVCLLAGPSGFSSKKLTSINFNNVFRIQEFIEDHRRIVNAKVSLETPYTFEIPTVDSATAMVRTSYSTMSGLHPILIAGMTPCTSYNNTKMIAAATNAGYHCELAGGGLPIPEMFREAVHELSGLIDAGRGIHINLLYLNKVLFDMHWPLLLEMKSEGYPIHSITFGAGAPAPAKALEIISQLKSAGMKYLSFKPGSAKAMAEVVEIARMENEFPIVVQWTGGQAGGHHSQEDQLETLKRYLPQLREFKNVYIFCGGGIGCGEDAAKYFTGEWSGFESEDRRRGFAVDGVLVGSRVCCTVEGSTVLAIKELIVQTEGIKDLYNSNEWELCNGPLGHNGIISVKSELGEPIHVLANRCGLLWKKLDQLIFELPYDQREAATIANRDLIINGLMNDFQKVWFPIDEAGKPCELADMTYASILRRYVELCTAKSDGRWFNITYMFRFNTLMKRVEELYTTAGKQSSFVPPQGSPSTILDAFVKAYPQSAVDLIQQDDIDYFLKNWEFAGKPVPFVPTLKNFAYWFKRDSLWFAEEADVIPNGDPQRVNVLMGPVAVARINAIEPVKDILDGINTGAAKVMAENAAESYGTVRKLKPDVVRTLTRDLKDEKVAFRAESWLATINEWVQSNEVFHSNIIVNEWVNLPESSMLAPNPLRDVLKPMDDTRSIDFRKSDDGSLVLSIQETDSCVTTITTGQCMKSMKIEFSYSLAAKPLVFELSYDDSTPLSPLRFKTNPEASLNLFYRGLWNVQALEANTLPDLRSKTYRGQYELTKEMIEDYEASLGVFDSPTRGTAESTVMMVWPLIAELITDIGGDLTRLVHLSHSFEWTRPIRERNSEGLKLGHKYFVEGSVTKCWSNANGVEVAGEFKIIDDVTHVMTLKSSFFVRQKSVESAALRRLPAFNHRTEETYALISASGLELLRFLASSAKSALKVDIAAKIEIGERLKVSTLIKESGERNTSTEIVVTLINGRSEKVATICETIPATGPRNPFNLQNTKISKTIVLLGKNASPRNPLESVSDFDMVSLADGPVRLFETPPTFQTPKNMVQYAKASRDTNVIHCSNTLAYFAKLPAGPIVHGMWTYAKAKKVFESALLNHLPASPIKVERFQAAFTAMVNLDDQLTLQASLKGHCNGRQVYDVEVVDSNGQTVMIAEAAVLGKQQTFIVTGQGSAQVGMGADLRQGKGCIEAKTFWDQAEKRFVEQYGISIVQIIDENPSSYIVDLRGEKGKQIRANLRNLADGSGNRLLPNLGPNDRSYRFSYPKGLLYATFFTQPAILINATTQYIQMKSTGLINSEDSIMCGHSLGEFGALAMMGYLTPSKIVDIAFYRGLCMDIIVPRKEGKSEFAMCAFNPSRVHPAFSEAHMTELVSKVAEFTESFIEVANYNVPGRQYVLTGNKLALLAFSLVCDELFKNSKDLSTNDERAQYKAISKCVISGIEKAGVKYEALTGSGLTVHDLELERGRACIPLAGIDVPFHSSHLRSSVKSFQSFLQAIFADVFSTMNVPSFREIENRYIPNLVGEPFSITKSYGRKIADKVVEEDPELLKILDDTSFWLNDGETARDEHVETIAMCFFTNLLSNQLASSVEWIKTQEFFLQKKRDESKRRRDIYGREMIAIECGATPILSSMVKGTCQLPQYSCNHHQENVPLASLISIYSAKDPMSVINQSMDGPDHKGPTAREAAQARQAKSTKNVSFEDETNDTTQSASSEECRNDLPLELPKISIPSVATGAAASVQELDDVPVPAVLMLRAVIAKKTGSSYEDIEPSKTIKEISGGKSTLVNELAADLTAELNGAALPNDAVEMTLEKLADSFTKYNKLGAVTNTMIQEIPFPAGYTIPNAKACLKSHGLGPMRADAALLLASINPPATRMANKAAAETFLDDCSKQYAAKLNISLPTPTAGLAGSPIMLPWMQMMGGATPANAGTVKQLDDVPVPAVLMLRAVIAKKTGSKISEISPAKTIKEISGGKSTLVNELAADLTAELNGAALPNDAVEMTLEKLADSFTKYNKLGAVTNTMIQEIPFPAGYTIPNAKACLKSHGLGPMRADAALLLASVEPPATRFSSKSEAESYLSDVAKAYSSEVNVCLPTASTGGNENMMMHMMMPGSSGNGKDEDLREQLSVLVKDVRNAFGELALASDSSEIDSSRSILQKVNDLQNDLQTADNKLGVLKKELGDEFTKGIVPKFDSNKMRSYTSSWAWVQQDSARLLTLVSELTPDQLKSELPELFSSSDIAIRIINKMTDKAKSYLVEGLDAIVQNKPETKELVKSLKSRIIELQSSTGRVPISNIVSVTSPDIVCNPAGPIFTKAKEVPRPEGWQHELMTLKSYGDSSPNQSMTSAFHTVVKEVLADGLDLQGKTVLVTGCGPGSIGIELVNLCLACGATVIATTSRDMSKSSSQIYREAYEKFGSTGAELHVVPCNGASVSDINDLIDFIYNDMKRDLDIVVPFAALPEKGKDITNIDARSELAHRLMYTNIERMLGRVVKCKQDRQKSRRSIELVDPAIFLLPCSPNHGIFGKDGLYAASKRSLEVLGNKCMAEGWISYASVVNISIGWTRGTSLMGEFDAVSAFIEHPSDSSISKIRTYGQSEMATYILSCMSPSMVEVASDEPYFADFSGGLALSPALISRVFGESFSTLREWNMTMSDILSTYGVSAVLSYFKELYSRRFTASVPQRVIGKPIELTEAIPTLKTEDKNRVIRGVNYAFPKPLESYPNNERFMKMGELIDLRKVPVIVGMAETGPFVNANTRWEREAYGMMSQDSILEVCLFLGYITPAEDVTENDGAMWVNTADNSPVHEKEIRQLFEAKITEKTGIRLLTLESFKYEAASEAYGYDGVNCPYFQSAQFERDSPIFTVANIEEGLKIKARQPDKVLVVENEDGTASCQILSGATLMLPAQQVIGFALAALVPEDYSFSRAGLPKSLETMDNASKMTVVTAADALLSSGLIDSWELFEHLHVSEVGSSIGGGFGGTQSIRSVFLDRMIVNSKAKVGSSTFSEVFINSAPAWVNMLLIGSNGPIRPAVGACGTAALSLENAVDSILKTDARVMLAGATDDYSRQSAFEFGSMHASRSSADEAKMGRSPNEASRPLATSRGGFLEASGSGICVVADAQFALDMGLPIRCVVAHVNSATDKISRSVPAPGKGILTTAAESRTGSSMFEDLDVRYSLFSRAKTSLINYYNEDLAAIEKMENNDDEKDALKQDLKRILIDDINALKQRYGHQVGKTLDNVSKLRSALLTWGMDIDDITAASFHGTSTKANDINEPATVDAQMKHLGRSPALPIHVVAQKSITGHPKGPAAQWMLNGAMQMMNDSVIPGNLNLDDVDEGLKNSEFLMFQNKAIRVPVDEHGMGVKAVLLKSFGFGQVGAEVLAIHPGYLFRMLHKDVIAEYTTKLNIRERRTLQRRQAILSGRATLLDLKQDPLVKSADMEMNVLLDPKARRDPITGNFRVQPLGFKAERQKSLTPSIYSSEDLTAICTPPAMTLDEIPGIQSERFALNPYQENDVKSVGFDWTSVQSMSMKEPSEHWIEYNFTDAEIEHCKASDNPTRAFFGRWVAKEAVLKAIGNAALSNPLSDTTDTKVMQGQHLAMKEIEICTGIHGGTEVKLHGLAAQRKSDFGIQNVFVSISYRDDHTAGAVAHCT